MAKKPRIPEENKKTEFETFRKIGDYEKWTLWDGEPSCFNGSVSIKKYKVTIELIEESPEVYIGRLQSLWSKCNNHHHWHPLQNAAKEFGLELKIDEVGRNK
jgi:hypothetical protein